MMKFIKDPDWASRAHSLTDFFIKTWSILINIQPQPLELILEFILSYETINFDKDTAWASRAHSPIDSLLRTDRIL